MPITTTLSKAKEKIFQELDEAAPQTKTISRTEEGDKPYKAQHYYIKAQRGGRASMQQWLNAVV